MTAAAGTPAPVPRWTDDVLRATTGEPVALIARGLRGWTVRGACTQDTADDLVEAMCLADLLAEESGVPPHPAAAPRRRGQPDGCAVPDPAAADRIPDPAAADRIPDPAAADRTDDETARQLADLRRTVAQLEHALAARVSTERAIGVLAERQSVSPRAAFEGLRTQARSSGRLVHDLAREVLATLPGTDAGPSPRAADPRPSAVVHPLRPELPTLVAPSPAPPSDETAARSGPRRVTRTDRRGATTDRRTPVADQPS